MTESESNRPANTGGCFLGIESSGEQTSVALVSGEQVRAEASLATSARHNEAIIQLLEQLLDTGRISRSRLAGIGVTLGPGMFTSLRVGMAVAKGLSMSLGIPLRGINTLDALAMTALRDSSVRPDAGLLPLIDAHKGEVYAALFQGAERKTDYVLAKPESLAAFADRPVTVFGSGVLAYRELIERTLSRASVILDLLHPGAATVARFAQQEISAGRIDDYATLAPFYLRRTDAELRRTS